MKSICEMLLHKHSLNPFPLSLSDNRIIAFCQQNGFQLLLSAAHTACTGVKASQLACQPHCLPKGTALNSTEIILWCLSVGFCNIRNPWLVSVTLKVHSSVASTSQSHWQRVFLPAVLLTFTSHSTACQEQT